jgi:hypothetical protein
VSASDCKDGIKVQNRVWFTCIWVSSAFHESFWEIPKFGASATSLVLASCGEKLVPHRRSLSITTSYDETSKELEKISMTDKIIVILCPALNLLPDLDWSQITRYGTYEGSILCDVCIGLRSTTTVTKSIMMSLNHNTRDLVPEIAARGRWRVSPDKSMKGPEFYPLTTKKVPAKGVDAHWTRFCPREIWTFT